MSINLPDVPKVLPGDWLAWVFRVTVMVFFAASGYLGKQAVDDIRTTKDTVIEMHATQAFRDREVQNLAADLKDHEVRLRAVEVITSNQRH